ncbi:MAG TPA: plastocyanin/azurin family copper-binding protein [Gaiellaceae bacterium]|nr:plastocyanin/azurin family copper-binding protein [Gaiellaceae bacterium]
MRRLGLLAPLAAVALAAAACGGREADRASSPPPATPSATETAPAPAQEADGGDPRDGGFEVALGEWAVTPEATAIRPGRATFLIVNRGTMPHGFELEREDVEDDASKVETRVLQPGESVEVELDLAAGVYKLECNVEGHDDMGMEMLLEVRPDAPVAAKAPAAKAGTAVAVEAFAFSPAEVTAQVGQPVTWENHDPAGHTVTAEDGSFDSGTMARGARYETTFDAPGEYRYICALHPGMKGTVVVEG